MSGGPTRSPKAKSTSIRTALDLVTVASEVLISPKIKNVLYKMNKENEG
jgi:hypothetical protein